MKENYEKARKLGEKAARKARFEGRNPYLPALEDLVVEVNQLPQVRVGLVEIPLSMIRGTKTRGRQNAFAENFMPLLDADTEFAAKWSQLYDSAREEGIREPIKAYEYMRNFYVEEGNKRVSVMHSLDAAYASADVTRILPRKTEDKKVKVYYEFLDFYSVCPIYEIGFTEEGSYRMFAQMAGRDLETPWPDELIENVRAAYSYFQKAFQAKGGEKLNFSVGDAFLLYLRVYDLDSLVSESSGEIERRIAALWNEFLTEKNEDSVSLVKNPVVQDQQGAGNFLLSILMRPSPWSKEHPFRAAFIYDKNPKNSAWIYGHELGRNHLNDVFGGLVEAVCFEDCDTDDKIASAVETCVADGEDMIFTVSPSEMPETLRCAIRYPKIRFLNCSINISRQSVRTYYARMYEAKFLMGALAASTADNHRIGYCADYPIYGTIADINAFAIGAAMVDPRAEICLAWSSAKEEGISWQQQFESQGIRVISGPDRIKPENASREYGIYQISEGGEIENLAAPVLEWGRYYQLIVQSVFDGSWNSRELSRRDQAMNYWLGMSSGVIDVICSQHLSYYSRKMIATFQNALIQETLNPFGGELHSQSGVVRTADSPGLTDEEIITMNWLNDNVRGSIPAAADLKGEAKKTVEISGVREP